MGPQQTWNPERYARNARFVADLGAPVLDLLDPRPGIYEFKCDVNGISPWFQIDSCDIGNGKGNKSASPTCTASVERMADMLLTAKVNRIPVHVQRDDCAVSEVALKPIP